MSKVELDRKRRRMKWNSNGPHALACRKGEGPPIAPHGWQWFTGRRAKDIAFVSPSGQRFRSKVALDRFLGTIPDPPSQNDFAWRVRKSDFENVPLPGEEKRFSAHKKSSAKEIHKRVRPLKSRLKIQQLQKLQQDRRTSVLGDSSVISASFCLLILQGSVIFWKYILHTTPRRLPKPPSLNWLMPLLEPMEMLNKIYQ